MVRMKRTPGSGPLTSLIKRIKDKKKRTLSKRKVTNKNKRESRNNLKTQRVVPIPKQGGFLVPLITGLAALGGLIGGASNVVKVVDSIKSAKKQLEEAKRHNTTMEAIAIGKKGSGLYVKRYKKGYGLFIDNKKKTKLKYRQKV